MDMKAFPTKGNLIAAKNSLELAQMGYDLMDKKRNVLIKELMSLVDQAADIQSEIRSTFDLAYKALQKANIEMGISFVHDIAHLVPVDDSVEIKKRSVMGAEIPLVRIDEQRKGSPKYGISGTRESLDEARVAFEHVKNLTVRLSMIENSAFQLADNIKKTQKRANALKNITIPTYEVLVKNITNALEEKEREEFTRLKVIKRMHLG